MPAYEIQDGYTLAGATRPDFGGYGNLPVIAFRYRPAVWTELELWRLTAGTKEHVDATVQFVAEHLVSWDVTRGGKPAPITADVLKRFPPPLFEQLFAAVSTWADREQEAAAGNSAAASP